MIQFRPNHPRSAILHWRRKFAVAIRGVAAAVRTESSYLVHLSAAGAVVALAALLDLSAERWALLLLCIAAVLAAETFNTVVERLARAITREDDAAIRDALDMASGAVLLTSIGAAAAGAILMLPPLWRCLVG